MKNTVSLNTNKQTMGGLQVVRHTKTEPINPFSQYLDEISSNVSIKELACTDTTEAMGEMLDILISAHERQRHDKYVNLLKCLRSSESLFGDHAADYTEVD